MVGSSIPHPSPQANADADADADQSACATDAVSASMDVYNPGQLGPHTSQRIVLPEGITRAHAAHTIMQRVKTNEFGFPTHFIRSDLLPFDLGLLCEADVDNASVGLFYDDGYPQLDNGTAFWHQLPHEPYDAYLMFMAFLEQAEELGIRQLDLLAASKGADLPVLQTLSNEYLWSIRSRAHDVFVVAADQKKRFLLTRRTENKHFNMAGKLLATLETKFEDDEWLEELSAKEAIEMLDLLVKVQRLSLGLTGQNSSSTPRDRLPDGTSTEAIVRQITRNAGLNNSAADSFGSRLQALLDNPEEGMQIQAAILKIGRDDSYVESQVL